MGLHRTGYWRIFCLTACCLFLHGCDDDENLKLTAPVAGHWEAEYVRDFGYVEGRIFDLAYPGEIGPHDSVTVWVYEEERHLQNPQAEFAYLDAGSAGDDFWDAPGVLMTYVEPDQYDLLYGQDSTHCPVALVFYSRRSQTVGARILIRRFAAMGSVTNVDTIGYVGPGTDTLRILQPPPANNIPDHPAWRLMWRNCYRILRNARIDDLALRIFKGAAGSEGTTACLDYQHVVDMPHNYPYMQILGLDQYNLRGESIPDGKLDDRVEIFHPDWGMVIFPEREPFNSNRTFEDSHGNWTDTLAVKVPTLYSGSSLSDRMENSAYYLEMRYWIRDDPD